MSAAAHRELELKSVVPDPASLRERLRAAGAVAGYAGRLRDRRYDTGGRLAARDEVLRVREYIHANGSVSAELTWKGPTRRSPEGYKQRDEIELPVGGGDSGVSAGDLLAALGYRPIQTIDRWIETYSIEGASVRLEWYPRMDVLVEVEGEPSAIERAIPATGIDRAAFTAEPLVAFTGRFRQRTGEPILSLDALGDASPGWEHR